MKYHDMVFMDWQLGNIGDRTTYWAERFPNFGMCMTDATNKHAFIPIPRCGSQYFCFLLSDKHGWTGNHVFNYQNFVKDLGKWKGSYETKPKYFSILRDPLERYISALWCLYNPETNLLKGSRMDKFQLDHLFSNPSLNDHHTINQYNFFYNINLDDVAFFNFNDKNLGEKVKHYFSNELEIKLNTAVWLNKDSEEKDVIKQLFHDYPQYLETVKTYLEDDYKFLSTIKYYEPN